MHNDLAKEPNLLVRDDGSAAFIDFQLAWHSRCRGRLFRAAAREDIRHLLKHKRKYCPDSLTSRERALLKRRSWPARAWRRTVKPLYRWLTRKVLKRRDDEGRGTRNGPR